MKTRRILLPLAFAFAVTGATAQVTRAEEGVPTPPPPKPAIEAKKKEPKRTPVLKKGDPPKKSEAPQKAAPVATGSPNVRVYKAGDPNVPKLLDKDGKPIPTSPNAYDVSSATKK